MQKVFIRQSIQSPVAMYLQFSLTRLARFAGMDRAVLWTVVGKGWAALSGIASLFFIATYLSPEEQGFYFTFASILALQVFFELGLANVILNFTSHEKAKLRWTENGILTGNKVAKYRLSSLLRLSLLWYGIAAILIVLTVLPGGVYFFLISQPEHVRVSWLAPWVLVVLITAGNLLISPVSATLNGCGLVAEVAFLQLIRSVLGSSLLWVSLFFGAGLYSATIYQGTGFVTMLTCLLIQYRHLLLDIFKTHSKEVKINWWREVWPFQWKIAVSWLSGYFIFQLFNPVMFAFHGAKAAGQMGLSLRAINTIGSVALAWTNTKIPIFGKYIALNQYKKLDALFFKSLWQSSSIGILGQGLFLVSVLFLRHGNYGVADRILDVLPLIFLSMATIINGIVASEAYYLRAHKKEPFLWTSVAMGILISLTTIVLGKKFGAIGILTGYFCVNLIVGLGIGSWIFSRKRKEWHRT